MTNFSVRKLGNQFFISFRNNQIYLNRDDIDSFNFPEDFYAINSDIVFDFRIDSTAKSNLMEVAANYNVNRMLYDTEKFLAPTILSDQDIIARGQNPSSWKQTYTPVQLDISYKINNVVQKYSVNNVEARVKGFGSFLPYNRKMPLRVRSINSSIPINGFGTATDITINNMIQSRSKITEHIVYKIYRDYGMLAPRTNFIRVFINDSTIRINNILNNIITTNSNHYLFSGMRIKFVGLSNTSNDSIFYVISSGRTDTTFKISETLNGPEYSLPNLSNVNIEYYTDYGEYLNVENLKNLYKINEFFGPNGTTSLYEIGITTSNKELNLPSSSIEYSTEYGQSRNNIDNFITALGSTSNWYNNFSAYANVDQFIRFAVIELLLGQDDGYNTFLNNAYLVSDVNNKFHVIPWGADSYFYNDSLNSRGWIGYGRFIQQCWANTNTLSQFGSELVTFNNWLKNSNIINYINTIFDQKINDFTSDLKDPNTITESTLISGKNEIISNIQTTDDRVNYFLSKPMPVSNLSGQLSANGNFVMTWNPVTANVSGQSIANVTYEIIPLGSFDHKQRFGGWSAQDLSYGISTSDTTYTMSSGDINYYYSALQSNAELPEWFTGLHLTVVSKTSDDIWGFAAQPLMVKPIPVPPPASYVPNMKIAITEVMSNSTARYGLSSAPDWFEITNFDTSGINISGWRMDDDSRSVTQSVSLIPSGWNVLGSGESAIFIETNNPAVAIPQFRQFWNLNSSVKIGSYRGTQISFSSSGDCVHLFVPSGLSTSSFVHLTGLCFGSAITNRSLYWQYENNNVSVTGFSTPDSRGAYVGSGGSPIVYATGSPGIYATGVCTEVPYSYTSCYNIDALYNTIEPWDPTYCENQYSHTKYLPKNNYLVEQSVDPPSGSYDLLCSETYPISISNKIKIIIPDDPIFSGTYVFDYSPGGGDQLLQSDNWIFNASESNHGLSAYQHTSDIGPVAFDGKVLVSLSDEPVRLSSYQGYEEHLYGFYNNDPSAFQAFQNRSLDDAFAFPAEFIFTAVQPPGPCYGIPAIDPIQVAGTGHRLAVGFALPIRWRHPYKNWILVDRKTHTIENIVDYTSGVVFNDGIVRNIDGNSVYLNNSKSVRYAESWAPGSAGSIPTGGYLSISPDANYELFNICTGIPDIGFSFKAYGSGLGIFRNRYWVDGPTIEGIGGAHYFADLSSLSIGADTRPFFENKTPVKAIIEFVYSCRSGVSCSTFENVTPQTNIPIITGLYVGCPTYANYIGTDYLCGENNQVSPPDSYWTQNNITSTEIIYSGYNEKPFFYTDSAFTYRILPVMFTGQSSANRIVDIYDYNPSNSNNLISIRTTGGTPTQIREFLRSSLFAHKITTLNSNPANITVTNSSYNKWDLYWTVNTGLYTAKVYIIPDTESIPSPTIFITGAGSSSVNGTYYYDSYGRGYNPDNEFYGGIFVKDAQSRIALSVSGSNVPYQWRIQKLIDNNWVNYYGNNGVYTGIINYTNNSRIGTSNTNWYTNSFCFSGANPPPSSITYYYR